MKSKYCFIRHPEKLCPGDFVYHLYVGSSLREQTKFALIQEFCNDCGLYLRRWSDDVDRCLELAAKSWRSKESTISHPFRGAQVSVNELWKMIIDDSFDKFEATMPASKFEIYLSHHSSTKFIRCANKTKVSQNADLTRRKNLSSNQQDSRVSLAIASGFILLLLMLHSLFERVCLNLFGAI